MFIIITVNLRFSDIKIWLFLKMADFTSLLSRTWIWLKTFVAEFILLSRRKKFVNFPQKFDCISLVIYPTKQTETFPCDIYNFILSIFFTIIITDIHFSAEIFWLSFDAGIFCYGIFHFHLLFSHWNFNYTNFLWIFTTESSALDSWIKMGKKVLRLAKKSN